MNTSKAFTLIELLVVIAVIGILSSIVLASLTIARTKGEDASRISNVRAFKTALEMYANDNGGYPTSNGSVNGDVPLNDAVLVAKLVPQYIAAIPQQLITDGDRYYTNGLTSGFSNNYDMRIYMKLTNSQCRTGTLPGNTGDWGIPTVCNF